MPLLNQNIRLADCSRACEQAVQRAAVSAVEAANARHAPVILRLRGPAISLPEMSADPWDAIAPLIAANPGQPVVLWHDDRAAMTFAALGAAGEFTVSSAVRFATIRARATHAVEAIIDVPFGPVSSAPGTGEWPELIGGFAFAPTATRPAESADVWAAWPSGWMVLPRILLAKQDQQISLTIAEAVAPGSDPADLADTMLAANLAVCAAIEGAPAFSNAATPPNRPRDHRSAPSDAPAARRAEWLATAARARDAVRLGEFGKLVLARSEAFDAPPAAEFDAIATARQLRRSQPGCIAFAIGRPDGTAFVGATPEILVRVKGREFHTVALAGTRKSSRERAEDDALGRALLASAKDRDEQEIVVRAIAQTLAPFADSLTVANAPRIAHFATVQHLETPIAGQLRDGQHILDLVAALHPTPAVGGLPAESAMAWLAAHEDFDRGWYAGPIGWFTAAGDGCFAVAIRSALLAGSRAHAFAGAGIVADSDPAAEWDEIDLKFATVAQSLAIREAARQAEITGERAAEPHPENLQPTRTRP